jgi:uncharacterized protein (TIGR02646 family)
MTHGKCAYCECLLDASSYAVIEHHTARLVDGSLAFEWTNLFLACSRCNGAKGAADHGGEMLKPDHDDPEEFLWVDHNGEIKALDSRGDVTARLCHLNRGSLLTLRTEAMHATRQCIQSGDCDAMLRPGRQFKLAIRTELKRQGRADLAQEDRRLFG